MKDLTGKTAFVTGGASGLGLAMAEAFGREGMNVMVADLEQDALSRAVAVLRSNQIRAEGVLVDVTSRDSLRKGALATLGAFGKVHLVCNNAGISIAALFGQVPERDWNWVMDVNLKGVVNGMEVFVPLIERHGEGGHFVNTASVAAIYCPGGGEPYGATKYAILAMSEGWRAQLSPKNIGVSVLCPGVVVTNLFSSHRNRQAAYGGAVAMSDSDQELANNMMPLAIEASVVAARVLEAVRDNELHIFTHVEFSEVAERRAARISEAFGRLEHSPALDA
jgi:NAD(P)-dependent dehydrogenase (short-subunit alcohol dehydrogenase family)